MAKKAPTKKKAVKASNRQTHTSTASILDAMVFSFALTDKHVADLHQYLLDRPRTRALSVGNDPEDWWVCRPFGGETKDAYARKGGGMFDPAISGPFTESKALAEAERLRRSGRFGLGQTASMCFVLASVAIIGSLITLGCLQPYLIH